MNLPYFYFGLPAFVQGLMLVLVFAAVVATLGAIALHFLRKSVANQRKVGATPAAENGAATQTVEEKKCTLITKENPSTLRMKTTQPRAYTCEDEEFYDIPTIVRRQSTFTNRETQHEVLAPITKRLFSISAEAKRLSPNPCMFSIDHIDLNKRLFGLFGNNQLSADNHRYGMTQ